MLYLHGSNIRRAAEIDRLSELCCLRSLTLHGNPVEGLDYRMCVLSKLPQLMSIDFSVVTKPVLTYGTSSVIGKKSTSPRQDIVCNNLLRRMIILCFDYSNTCT